MGLIRKTLAVGTVGVVNGSSKKQRNAKAALHLQEQILGQLQAARSRGPAYAQLEQLAASGNVYAVRELRKIDARLAR
jgi:type II secretory pathway pseudopilin PulG